MMVNPWLIIGWSIFWMAAVFITCRLSERTAREWEKNSNEWRRLAIAHAAAARYWQRCALSRSTDDVRLVPSSPLDGLTATQIGDQVH